MARQVVETLIDDIDGKTADETVRFGFDGVDYTIDVSNRNASKLRTLLSAYQDAGTRLGRPTPSTPGRRGTNTERRTNGRNENKAIRAWAAEHGKELPTAAAFPQPSSTNITQPPNRRSSVVPPSSSARSTASSRGEPTPQHP